MEWHVYPWTWTVVSVSEHPTNRVGLIQIGHHHHYFLVKMALALACGWLKNCSLGAKQQSLTHSPTNLYLNYLYNNIFSTHVISAVGVTLIFIFESIFVPTASSILKRETLFECMVIIPTLKRTSTRSIVWGL